MLHPHVPARLIQALPAERQKAVIYSLDKPMLHQENLSQIMNETIRWSDNSYALLEVITYP